MNSIALDPALLTTQSPLSGHTTLSALKDHAGDARHLGKNSPLYQKAKQLEGLFLNTLVSEMFKDIKTKGMFGGGYAEKTWRSMQAEQLSSEIAQSGGVGLADNIMQNLLSIQEATASSSKATASNSNGV